MNKIVIVFFSLLSFTLHAQVTDETVSLGTGYANQVWYSLSDGEESSAAMNNWDLSFDVSAFGVAIFTNSVTGTMLWNYENGDIADWAIVDTTGLSTWQERFNSDTSWAGGAFNNYVDPENEYDVDWGIYNPTTHVISGDSIYIIKLSNGEFKKLIIESVIDGAFNFKYANIDGSSEENVTLIKSNYTGKNFAYYSIQNNAEVDREPLAANWDLLFGQYTTLLTDDVPYTVTGVLSNINVTVAQAAPVDQTTYTDYAAQTFFTAINTIGYDWKSFSGTAFVLSDTTVYFVKTANADIWKIVFTGFEGSATGNIEFNKELLTTTGIEIAENNNASIALYPNPAEAENITLIYTLEKQVSINILSIYDASGRLIITENLNTNAGLHQHTISNQNLAAGIYFVNLMVDGKSIQQKLIVK